MKVKSLMTASDCKRIYNINIHYLNIMTMERERFHLLRRNGHVITILLVTVVLLCLMPEKSLAQTAEFKTFVYTSDQLYKDIKRVNDSQDKDPTRRFGAEVASSTLNAGKGIASGYITSFLDLGVNAIASLVTSKAKHKSEWLQTVQEENSWSTTISNVDEIKDFYKTPSESGALDPQGMTFDGIGCMRTEGSDTVFFISCHIDRSKLNRIVNHSKFELVLDTLIISPSHSNLPNTDLDIDYSFKQRNNFNLSVTIKVTSSWFTDAIELHNNEQLGEFTINIPVNEEDLDSRGFLRYVRPEGDVSKYKVKGESFIIPRSYMGYREGDYFHNIWGTGQYNLSIELKETCGITEEYKNDWQADRKQRKRMQKEKENKRGFFPTVWQTISKQDWDDIAQQWVITTLSAPAGVISEEMIEVMGLSTSSSSSSTN